MYSCLTDDVYLKRKTKREIKLDGYKKIAKIIRHNYEQNKGSKVSCTPYSRKRSTDLLSVQMMFPQKQHRIIEQAKSTYSLLRKALAKQVKTIGQQGEQQRKALTSREKNNYLHLMRIFEKMMIMAYLLIIGLKIEMVKDSLDKKIIEEIYERRIDRINKIDRQINFNTLVGTSGSRIDFRSITNPRKRFDEIKSGKIPPIDARIQKSFLETNLGKIMKIRKKKNNKKKQ